MNSDKNVLIVGFGIAGAMVSWFLRKTNIKFKIINEDSPSISSRVAAGIVNPITGKNYSPSWRIQEFLPFALETYQEIGDEFGFEAIKYLNIVRALYSPEDENKWFSKINDPFYQNYILPKAETSYLEHYINLQFSSGELKNTFCVNINQVLNELSSLFLQNKTYQAGKFDYHSLSLRGEKYYYQDEVYDGVIFCEGYKAMENPFLKTSLINPNRGDVLKVKIPDFDPKIMYKDNIFLVPQGEGIFWVGATYQSGVSDMTDLYSKKEFLAQELARILKVEFEILDYLYSVRPTTSSRIPFSTFHEEHPNMLFFNGLGTKGSSTAPLLAKEITNDFIFRFQN